VPKRAFIVPSAPVLKKHPPTGPQWIHEVKFDGWRAQLHKSGDDVVIFSRNAKDLTSRFPAIHDSIDALPARSVIIDAEIVANDANGKPDFSALMSGKRDNLCAWCFDLMELDGCDLTTFSLLERRIHLRHLLKRADDDRLRYSDEFGDPVQLLQVCEEMGLEGIISKLAHQSYKPGNNPGWIKVKARAWREANRDRWEMFQRKR
jgi:bifunctional non-homologous end joining protein LigD